MKQQIPEEVPSSVSEQARRSALIEEDDTKVAIVAVMLANRKSYNPILKKIVMM